MAELAKLTVSVPRDLILLADKVAKEEKVSRSKVVTRCLQELAQKRRQIEMAKGYRALVGEQFRIAKITEPLAHEVLPEWK